MPTTQTFEYLMTLCRFPEQLHPFSQMIWNMLRNGDVNLVAWYRLFSLPNSDYLDFSTCFVMNIQMLLAMGSM